MDCTKASTLGFKLPNEIVTKDKVSITKTYKPKLTWHALTPCGYFSMYQLIFFTINLLYSRSKPSPIINAVYGGNM